MKRWLGRVVLLASCVMFVVTLPICARSFFVNDAIGWNNYTEEPMTPAAYAWAQRSSSVGTKDVRFIVRGDAMGITTWSGRISWTRSMTQQPTTRWDEAFAAKYLNHPQWYHNAGIGDAVPFRSGGFWDRIGFDFIDRRPTRSLYIASYRCWTAPLWLVTLISAVLPARWIMRTRRLGHRRKHGLCLVCGYDLRGSAGRCPECGGIREGASDPATGTAI